MSKEQAAGLLAGAACEWTAFCLERQAGSEIIATRERNIAQQELSRTAMKRIMVQNQSGCPEAEMRSESCAAGTLSVIGESAHRAL